MDINAPAMHRRKRRGYWFLAIPTFYRFLLDRVGVFFNRSEQTLFRGPID